MEEELIDIYDRDRRKTGLVLPREGLHLEPDQRMLYVYALIENEDGLFLVTRRSLDKSWAAGAWEVTGGGVRAGETPWQAICREVREETGLDVAGQPDEPVYSYENVDVGHGDNYFADVYHFHLEFSEDDVTLQRSEAIDFRLATWDEISAFAEHGEFLHYERLRAALRAEGLL